MRCLPPKKFISKKHFSCPLLLTATTILRASFDVMALCLRYGLPDLFLQEDYLKLAVQKCAQRSKNAEESALDQKLPGFIDHIFKVLNIR